jgi:DNA-nicking Smr family endonuclease
MNGKRKLTQEEHELWHGVTRSIAELRRGRRRAARDLDGTPPEETAQPKSSAQQVSSVAPVAITVPPPATFDRRLKQRIARGTHAIDARLDLHGLTQARAYDALRTFVRKSQSRGAKIVLVITGKGDPTRDDLDGTRGVLKRQVPLWLKGVEFRTAVVGFERAGAAHGGEGALYVRLRRPRSASR